MKLQRSTITAGLPFLPAGFPIPRSRAAICRITRRLSAVQTGGGIISAGILQGKRSWRCRYAVSMEAIDRKLQLDLILFLGVALVIIAFVLISGLYFVKSIVLPVRDVGAVARKFATGDMSARIVKKSNDELGELCDIINFMADEISASEEMKNEFISSVSHELRTPLTAIKGWSETLMSMGEGESSPEMIQKGMRVITNETERLSIMVEELLDFSRMQNGRFMRRGRAGTRSSWFMTSRRWYPRFLGIKTACARYS